MSTRHVGIPLFVARIATVAVASVAIIGFVLRSLPVSSLEEYLTVGASVVAVAFVALKIWLDSRRELERAERVASIEQKAVEHPEKPQLAWDLARVKLENYLDRNLSQVTWIFVLTVVVMACGFAFIMFGLYRAFDDKTKLDVAIVSSASGVIVSFIGGSFLLIYRSILASAKEYVTVLERINAVGMAVQVIGNIPDDSVDLKQGAMADLAKQLLSLYGSNTAISPPSARRQIKPKTKPTVEA